MDGRDREGIINVATQWKHSSGCAAWCCLFHVIFIFRISLIRECDGILFCFFCSISFLVVRNAVDCCLVVSFLSLFSFWCRSGAKLFLFLVMCCGARFVCLKGGVQKDVTGTILFTPLRTVFRSVYSFAHAIKKTVRKQCATSKKDRKGDAANMTNTLRLQLLYCRFRLRLPLYLLQCGLCAEFQRWIACLLHHLLNNMQRRVTTQQILMCSFRQRMFC